MGNRRAFPLERREKPLANYDRALEIDPRLIHAWHNKGNSLAAWDAKRRLLLVSIRHWHSTPSSPWPGTTRGTTLLPWGAGEAIACFEQAVIIEPQLTAAWGSKANILTALGRREEALTCYNQALVHDPQECGRWITKEAASLPSVGLRKRLPAMIRRCPLSRRSLHPGTTKGRPAPTWGAKKVCHRHQCDVRTRGTLYGRLVQQGSG